MSPFPTLFALKRQKSTWIRAFARKKHLQTKCYLLFTILGEFERDLVFAVGAGQGYVLILDAKGSLAVDLELKFIVAQLVAAPIPALG